MSPLRTRKPTELDEKEAALPDGLREAGGRRRRGRVLLALVLLAAAVAAGWLALPAGTGDDTAQTTKAPTAFADVVRTDLTEVETLDGVLEYRADQTVVNRLGGMADGQQASESSSGGAGGATLTGLAEPGKVRRRGGTLLEVDGNPVVLLYGARPAWRSLTEGADGADVRQLERNLKQLGFDADGDLTVDGDFNWATEEAVLDWQESVGAEADGVVDLGEVAFLRGAVRVDQQLIQPGSPVGDGTQILTVGSNTPGVTTGLETDQRDLVHAGDPVTIELPDGTETTARVESIASEATTDPATGETTIEVTISLDEPSVAKGLTGASVDVLVVTGSREDVLAAPVTALLAISGGGYAVEVDEGGGQTRVVPVDPGMFDNGKGLVEISAEGISVDHRVVVPS